MTAIQHSMKEVLVSWVLIQIFPEFRGFHTGETTPYEDSYGGYWYVSQAGGIESNRNKADSERICSTDEN